MSEDQIPKETIIHLSGSSVCCDFCNAEFGVAQQKESGGFLFGSYAVCPRCAPASLADIAQHGETERIKARCPEGVSFRDWVLSLRGGDNTIRIIENFPAKDLGSILAEVFGHHPTCPRCGRGMSHTHRWGYICEYCAGIED